jgi:hypothetical protein
MSRPAPGASPSDREPVRDLVGNDDLEGGADLDFEALLGEQASASVGLARQARLQCHWSRITGPQRHHAEDNTGRGGRAEL